MTAEENPFVADTSSLQNQLIGSFSFCFFCSSILLSNLFDVEVVLFSLFPLCRKRERAFDC